MADGTSPIRRPQRAGGQFSFQNLEPGQYRLSATRNGYVRMEYGARSPNRPGLPITLNPGQKLADVVLQLMPAGTISGRVFDRDGEPLANVTVEALKYSYQEGQRVMNVVQTARTNDLGEYRLFWLQPGQYFVSATPPENSAHRFAECAGGCRTRHCWSDRRNHCESRRRPGSAALQEEDEVSAAVLPSPHRPRRSRRQSDRPR